MFGTGRQKTLSVKWRQCTANTETKLHEKKKDVPIAKSPGDDPIEKCGEFNSLFVHQDSKSALKKTTAAISQQTDTKINFDCLQSQNSDIVMKNKSTGFTMRSEKTDSC